MSAVLSHRFSDCFRFSNVICECDRWEMCKNDCFRINFPDVLLDMTPAFREVMSCFCSLGTVFFGWNAEKFTNGL